MVCRLISVRQQWLTTNAPANHALFQSEQRWEGKNQNAISWQYSWNKGMSAPSLDQRALKTALCFWVWKLQAGSYRQIEQLNRRFQGGNALQVRRRRFSVFFFLRLSIDKMYSVGFAIPLNRSPERRAETRSCPQDQGRTARTIFLDYQALLPRPAASPSWERWRYPMFVSNLLARGMPHK